MDENRKRTIERWKKMNPDDFKANLPEETRRMKHERFMEKLKKFFWFISFDSGVASSNNSTTTARPTQDIRATYHVDVPPRTPTLEERIIAHRVIEDMIRDTDGIPNDLQCNRPS